MYKKIIAGILLAFSTTAYSQQVVDLSTGVYNNTTTLIPFGTDDDTWQVKTPSSAVFTNVKTAWIYTGVWATDPNVRWLSPAVSTSGSAQSTTAGNYTYKTTFTASASSVCSAIINLTKYGGDNTVTSISLNGFSPHTLGGGYSPLSTTAISVTGEIIPGVNTVTVVVNNLGHYTGLVINGNLTIDYIPTANAGPDQTICVNSCTIIGTAAISGNSYQWSTIVGSSSVVVGNTAQPSVCPPRTPASTVYTVMVTNNISGCTSTDQVTISVEDNNPTFTLASSYSSPNNYYTLLANPLVTVQPAGSGVAWYVDEIVSPTNTTLIANSDAYNPSCWWSPNTCNFNGYNGPSFTTTGNNPMTGGCGNPVVGHFTVNHAYRIIRGTWSSVCPWQQYSLIAYTVAGFTGGPIINIVEDLDAPDYSYLMTSSPSIENEPTDIAIYPNPSTGSFTISSETQNIQRVIVNDALGRIVKEIKNISANKTEISLENENKGFYFVEIIYEGQAKPVYKKIILDYH